MAALADLTGASDAAAAEGSSDITDGALLKALAAMWVGLGTVPVALVAAAEQVEAAEAFADEIAGIVPAPVPVLAQDRTHQGWRWLRSDGDDRRGGASLVAADIAVCLGADMPGGWSRELSEAYLDGGAEIVRCLRPDMPPQTSIGAAAASLYSKGVAIDPVRLAPREALPVILPAYPFERQRFWFDAA